jgi:hypothetical protein
MPAAASNFDFLRAEWPEIFESAAKAESNDSFSSLARLSRVG